MPPLVDNEENSNRLVTLREIMITIAGLVLVVLTLVLGRASAMVVLVTARNETLPFPDMEASFAPRVPTSGISGLIVETQPRDACEPLRIGPDPFSTVPVFALVERGRCKFDEKVINVQSAGFSAVIVYNNEVGNDLVSMSGNSYRIHIPAVFVSRSAGETLIEYTKQDGARCYILPAIENTAWSVMAVSFISLLAVTAVLTTFLFVRRYRLRRLGSRLLLLRDSLGMSSREVKALPTVVYKSSNDTRVSNSETCAICLEDYESGEKLRVLPCHHDFHVACIDQWLTTRRPFCPVCKRDAHTNRDEAPPSETTPLLAGAGAVMGVGAGAAPAVLVPVVNSTQAGTQTSPVGSVGEGCVEERASLMGSVSEEESSSVAFVFHSAPQDTFLQMDYSTTSAEHGENMC